MAHYSLRQKAKLDIEEIWNYTDHKWSENQVNYYFNSILDQIEAAAKNPEIGKSYGQVVSGYRRIKVKSHYIFYLIDAKDSIEIIRILHMKMDIDHHLTE